MRNAVISFARKAIADQRGQILPISAVMLVALLSLGGLSMDFGRAYIAQARLQTYANASVLAAAGVVYNTSTTDGATTYANNFSASTGDNNAVSYMGTVTTSVTTKCLNMLLPSGTCGTGSPANAVQVRESASIPTTFMALLGKKTMNISAVATASMQGKAQTWNVAIILDDTGSMGTTDTNCGGVTEFKCATNGIQALLAAIDPCSAGASNCSTGNFHVALFMFPGVSYSYTSGGTSLSYLTNCNGTVTTPSFVLYTLPVAGASSYAPLTYKKGAATWTGTYEVTYGASDADANGFVSDYYNATASNGLNSSSSINQAIGGCMTTEPMNWNSGNSNAAPVMQAASTGGVTYYASVIYAAQAALVAEQKANSGSKNAIIFLSDGQAQLATSTNNFPTAYTGTANSAGLTGLNTLTSNGTYPSGTDECQQAIKAAQDATTAGTRVFGVAYGSEQSGCATAENSFIADTTLWATGNNASFTLATLSPCVTVENIASSLGDFYSDYLQSGSQVSTSCVDNSHSVTTLQDISLSIAAQFTNPRLLPNNAAGTVVTSN